MIWREAAHAQMDAGEGSLELGFGAEAVIAANGVAL